MQPPRFAGQVRWLAHTRRTKESHADADVLELQAHWASFLDDVWLTVDKRRKRRRIHRALSGPLGDEEPAANSPLLKPGQDLPIHFSDDIEDAFVELFDKFMPSRA